MKKLLQLLAVSAVLSCLPRAAGAAVSLNGLLDAGYPVWNRISDAPGYPDSSNDALPYDVIEIVTSVPGDTLTAAVGGGTQFDSFLALYSSFHPANPQANLLVADDDGGGYPHAKITASGLAANTSYFLVITSYSGGANSVFPLHGSYLLNLGGSFSVVQKPSATVLSATPETSGYGLPVTFTATVVPGAGSAAPTGTVSFREGETSLGAGQALNASGQASLAVSSLSVGTHLITAAYSGDTRYGASTSAPVSITVVGPPVVATGTATGQTATWATLNGTVSDNGSPTTVSFEYGTSAAYGSNVPATTGGSIGAGAGTTAVAVELSGLTCGTTYHFRVSAVNLAGVTNGSDQSFDTGLCDQILSVTLAGTGTGSVNSVPPGIHCVSGSTDGCSSTFAGGTPVNLSATESPGSSFGDWSFCDSVSGTSCMVTMNAARTPQASFILQQNLKIAESYFGTMQSALDGVKAGQTIKAAGMLLPDSGTVTYKKIGVRAKLSGGFDSGFTAQSGYSFLAGVLKVLSGTLAVDHLKVK